MDNQIPLHLDDAEHGERGERRGVSGRELLYGLLGVLAGLLVLSGVWFAANRSDARPALPQVSEIDQPAADFALQTLDGGTVKLSDYRGKIVLLNFWRTDCVPCQSETPALEAAYQALKDEGVAIIGVNLFRDEALNSRARGVSAEELVRQFVTLYGVSYPIALDADGVVAQAYLIGDIPVSYMIDRDGRARFVRIGELTTPGVKAMVQELQQRAQAAQAQQ